MTNLPMFLRNDFKTRTRTIFNLGQEICDFVFINNKSDYVWCSITTYWQLIISSKLYNDRPNNHNRSRELRTFLYDVADLWLETVTKFFPRTMFDGLSWKFCQGNIYGLDFTIYKCSDHCVITGSCHVIVHHERLFSL